MSSRGHFVCTDWTFRRHESTPTMNATPKQLLELEWQRRVSYSAMVRLTHALAAHQDLMFGPQRVSNLFMVCNSYHAVLPVPVFGYG